MKKLSLLVVLLLVFSALSSQRSDKDPEGFIVAYKAFLESVSCDTASVESLEAFFPFEDSFPVPGFGMNGKMDYSDQDSSTDDFLRNQSINYTEEVLLDAIRTLDPTHLRFPGGTISSGYQLYPKRTMVDDSTITHKYYLNNESALSDSIPNSFTSLYLSDEGMSFKNELFFEPANGLNSHGLAGADTLIDFTCTRKYDSTGYELYLDMHSIEGAMIPHWTSLEFIILKDFIAFTDQEGISPLYSLRMFDPLYFIERNTSGGNNIQASPLLLYELGFNVDVDNSDAWFNASNMTLIRGHIAKLARKEIRRQMVKYVYEYLNLVGSLSASDEILLTEVLNSNDLDQENGIKWNEFLVALTDTTDTLLDDFNLIDQSDIRFELGNETWDRFMYKFMPKTNLNLGFSDTELLDPSFYGQLCKSALVDIDAVFPDARTAVVGGDRRGHCGWNTVVDSVITSNLDGQYFDAWVYHYYSPYDTLTGTPSSYLDPIYETYISSTISRLAGIQDSDQLDGLAPNRPVWYTEFNVNLSGNIFPGSWFDFIGKLKLINQYWSSSSAFKTQLQAESAQVQSAFNLNSPPMEIEMLLMHTLLSNGQSALSPIFNVNDSLLDFQFLDQGLISNVISKAIADDHHLMSPILFRKSANADLVSSDLISHTGTVPSGSVQCNADSTISASEPKVWGWLFHTDNQSGLEDFRQLIVNGSNECVILGGIQAYNPSNVDIFMFKPPIDSVLEQVNMTGDLLDFIQNVEEGGVYDIPTGFCFHTGDLNGVDDVDLLVGNQIVIPPYSVILLEGDIHEEECGGLVSTFLGMTGPPAYTITSDTTWTDENFQVVTDIVIEDGGSLIIDGGSLMMASGTQILVEQGGNLEVLGGAVLTSCGETWDGIEVQGDPNGQAATNNPGRVYVHEDAVIEHAVAAFRNAQKVQIGTFVTYAEPGGVIQISNSVLRNNKLDVDFITYQNMENGSKADDRSYFADSDFTIDDQYRFGSGSGRSMLFNGCDGMKIQGCRFSDFRASSLKKQVRRTGIRLVNSTMRMNRYCESITPGVSSSCAWIGNEFNNLSQGVTVIGPVDAEFNNWIQDSYFDCWNGVMLKNSVGDVVWNNEFSIQPPDFSETLPTPTDYPAGLYLNTGADDYAIEGNEFYGTPNSTATSYETIGIVARTNNGSNELVYRNTFHDLVAGFESINRNKTDSDPVFTGLELTCNSFIENVYDMYIMETSAGVNQAGIKSNQGAIGLPTFNVFDNQGSLTLEILNYIPSSQYTLRYFHRNAQQQSNLEYPFKVTTQVNTVDRQQTFASGEEICENTTNFDNEGEMSAMMQEGESAEYGMQEMTLLIDQMEDGGETSTLHNAVVLSSSSEIWGAYISLMNESGYISDSVLTALASREDGFTAAQIRDVFVANSHSASDAKLDSVLNQRSNPLPQYMRDQINQGIQNISPLEYLEIMRSGYKTRKDEVLKRIRLIANSDSSDIQDKLSWEASLLEDGDLESKFTLLSLYDSRGNEADADSIIIAMNNLAISQGRQGEVSRYSSLRNQIRTWENEDSTGLAINELRQFILEGYLDIQDRTSTWAESILIGADLIELQAPVFLPDSLNKELRTHKIDSHFENEAFVRIFPNPAESHFTVDYLIDQEFEKAEIRISNILGQTQMSFPLSYSRNQVIVQERLDAGVYLLELLVDNQRYKATTLIVEE